MYKISALTKEATRDPLLSVNKEVGSHQTQNLPAPRATHFMVLCYNSPNGLREKKVTLKCSTFKKMNIYYLFFFVNQESKWSLAGCFWLRVSHKTIIKV